MIVVVLCYSRGTLSPLPAFSAVSKMFVLSTYGFRQLKLLITRVEGAVGLGVGGLC